MERNKFGKIVATIGPASSSVEMLERLFVAGVDVFRLGFSHGTHEGHAEVFHNIRNLEKKYGYSPAILADMQGPKLRVGVFQDGKIELKAGDIFRFDLDKTPGDQKRVNLPHKEILEALHVGSTLLIDDGKLKVEVINRSDTFAETKVIVGGTLSNTKGVNVPDVVLAIPAITEKDLKDLNFALDLGVDFVAVSFVQSAKDVLDAREIIKDRAKIVTKIEKPKAVDDIEAIIEASDAIMIARGDLAVEMSYDVVPDIQRDIIELCHDLGRPVIVATQMLESMITSPTPTRAEASDVATAVYCGADATMLSAESAYGSYPFEAVSTMEKVIETTELTDRYVEYLEKMRPLGEYSIADGLAFAANKLAELSCSSAIVLFTNDYETVMRFSRSKCFQFVFVATNCLQLARQVSLLWGCYSKMIEKQPATTEDMFSLARTIVKERLGDETSGENIVVLCDCSEPAIHITAV